MKKNMINNKFNRKKIIKYIGYSTILGVCMFGSYSIGKEVGINSPATSKYYSPRAKIATVNGEEISTNDFIASMKIYFQMNKSQKFSKEEISVQEDDNINYSVTTKAVYDVAKDENITVDEKAVSENYSTVIEQLTQSLFMNEEEIFKKFNLTKEGIMNNLTRDYIVNTYLEQNSTVSEEEALEYYNKNQNEFIQYKASHILIAPKDLNNNDELNLAKEKAENLLQEIKSGANFEDLATKYSDDDVTSSEGGDLGYFGKGEITEELENALDEIETGQLHTSVIKTELGYHIIKKTDQYIQSFDDTKDNIIAQMSYNKKEEILDKIMANTDVKIHFKK